MLVDWPPRRELSSRRGVPLFYLTGSAAQGDRALDICTAGLLNCAAWTSGSAGDGGAYAGLVIDRDAAAGEAVGPWRAVTRRCDMIGYVWCVQD